ncbi:hypothetical protein [Nocardioides zeae]
MARVVFEGKRLDDTTRDRLVHARKVSGLALVVTQGGYNAGGVAASAGTHDGGGVLDIRTRGLSLEDKKRAVLVLRQAGFVAWLRTVAQGFDVEHIHAVELASTTLSAAAQRQVDAWRKGRNGLASNRPDDGPRVDIPTAMPGATETQEDDMTPEERDTLNRVDQRLLTLMGPVEEIHKWVRGVATAMPTVQRWVHYLLPATQQQAEGLAGLRELVEQMQATAPDDEARRQLEQIKAILG